MNKIKEIRVALNARLQDLAALSTNFGVPRPLALARTTLEQSRMLLGDVLKLRGHGTPYPQSDNPASPVIAPAADVTEGYDPALPQDEIAAVKTVRARLQAILDSLATLRPELWARDYYQLEQVVFDAAYVELVLCKNWLGMLLAALAETPVEIPAPSPSVPALVETPLAKAAAQTGPATQASGEPAPAATAPAPIS